MSGKSESFSLLDLLQREELTALAVGCGGVVSGKAGKAELVASVSTLPAKRLASALAELSRDRLKELCRRLGLDDSGREKEPLARRLAQRGEKPVSAAKSNGQEATTPTASPTVP